MDINSVQSKPIYIRAAGGLAAGAASVSDIAGRTVAMPCVNAEPIVLRERVAQVAPQVSRMASRFSQLALLGAADCLSHLDGVLDPNTRIYLGTGLGDIAHTDALYYSVMPPFSEMPSPARFATSGNNMAAFFVAQHAKLSSRNLTLSQGELSLECALELALSDFAAGATRSALIGGVDETTEPREFYTRRFHVQQDEVIGEGSGWLVLDVMPERSGSRALGAILGSRLMSKPAWHEVGTWITQVRQGGERFAMEAARTHNLTLLPGSGIKPYDVTALNSELGARWSAFDCQDYLRWTGRFPTAAALGIVSLIVRGGTERQTFLHVNRDATGRTGVIAFEVYSTKSS